MVFFDYNLEDIFPEDSILYGVFEDVEKIVNAIKYEMLKKNFSLILKIFSFLYLMNMFKRYEFIVCPYSSRLIELLKMEFCFLQIDSESFYLQEISELFLTKKPYLNIKQCCTFHGFLYMLLNIIFHIDDCYSGFLLKHYYSRFFSRNVTFCIF